MPSFHLVLSSWVSRFKQFSFPAIPSAKIWAWFRKARTLIFGLCAVLSVAATIFLSVLLSQEWRAYSPGQRAATMILTIIDGATAISLYVMLVVRFKLRRETNGFVGVIALQIGANIFFTLLTVNPSFSCTAFGPHATCKRFLTGIITGNWVLSAFLLAYTAILSVMAFVHRDESDIDSVVDDSEKAIEELESGHTRERSGGSISWPLNRRHTHRRDSTSSFGTFHDLRGTQIVTLSHSPTGSMKKATLVRFDPSPSPSMQELNRSFIFPRQTIPQDIHDEVQEIEPTPPSSFSEYSPTSPFSPPLPNPHSPAPSTSSMQHFRSLASGSHSNSVALDPDEEHHASILFGPSFDEPLARPPLGNPRKKKKSDATPSLFPNPAFSSGSAGLPSTPRSAPAQLRPPGVVQSPPPTPKISLPTRPRAIASHRRSVSVHLSMLRPARVEPQTPTTPTSHVHMRRFQSYSGLSSFAHAQALLLKSSPARNAVHFSLPPVHENPQYI